MEGERLRPVEAPAGGGDAGLIRVDRAILEYRRGRSICIQDNGQAWLAAAVETGADALIDTMTSLGAGPPELVLTVERARSLGLDGAASEAVLVDAPGPVSIAWMRRMALAGPDELGDGVTDDLATAPAAAAARSAVKLAKYSALIPAAFAVRLGESGLARVTAQLSAGDIVGLSSADVAAYPKGLAASLAIVAEAPVPLFDAHEARFIAFRPADGSQEHIAIVIGEPGCAGPVTVRIHDACLTGDLFASLRCDCGDQLRGAVTALAEGGGGVILYMAQEGRGIGIVNKLRAYTLQDTGLDTLDANINLGFLADERTYESAARMLRQLGIERVRLMTNNPAKMRALGACDIEVVERLGLETEANPHNARYIETKARRAGHFITGLDAVEPARTRPGKARGSG